MEMCEIGSMSTLFNKTKVGLNEEQMGYVLRECLKGLQFLHKNKVVHRDVKAGNILTTDSGDIKLADFGVSACLKMTVDNRRTAIGSPYWMAPEVIQQERYDQKADIWSLGITAIELVNMRPPLYEINAFRAVFQIPNRDPPELTSVNGKPTSKELKEFISQCLQKEPTERADCDELLNSSFIKKYSRTKGDVLQPLFQIAKEVDALGLPTVNLASQAQMMIEEQIKKEREHEREKLKQKLRKAKHLKDKENRQRYNNYNDDNNNNNNNEQEQQQRHERRRRKRRNEDNNNEDNDNESEDRKKR
ncbi:MAG: putative Serine/threonine-protein kinase dst2, partial [Streblomastix strix]